MNATGIPPQQRVAESAKQLKNNFDNSPLKIPKFRSLCRYPYFIFAMVRLRSSHIICAQHLPLIGLILVAVAKRSSRAYFHTISKISTRENSLTVETFQFSN